MARYLIGENEDDNFGADENAILRIAWEAVKRRREAAKKRGKQLRLNGTVQETGYATYEDYEQYMEDRRQREQLKNANWDLARVRYEIRDTLLSKGWTASPGHPETRFYQPELPAEVASNL